VLGDGEHHNAAVATLDFLGNRDRISSLGLYPHAEADKKAAKQVQRVMRREGLRPTWRSLPELLRK